MGELHPTGLMYHGSGFASLGERMLPPMKNPGYGKCRCLPKTFVKFQKQDLDITVDPIGPPNGKLANFLARVRGPRSSDKKVTIIRSSETISNLLYDAFRRQNIPLQIVKN